MLNDLTSMLTGNNMSNFEEFNNTFRRREYLSWTDFQDGNIDKFAKTFKKTNLIKK